MEWIRDNFRQALIIALITATLSVIGSVIGFSINTRKQILQNAASLTYVDRNIAETKAIIKAGDDRIDLRVSKVESDLTLKADKADIVRMDNKLDKIYEILIEMAKDENTITK